MLNGRTAVAMCVLELTAGGCRFDTTLDAKAGGTMKVAYRLGKDGSLDRAKKSFESPNIKIGDATIDKDKNVTMEIAFADVTKLSTAQMFNKLQIKRTVETDGTVALTGTIANKQPIKVSQESLAYFGKEVTVTVTAPGDIVSTNATSKDGKTATWVWPTESVFGEPEIKMELSYKGGA